MTKGVFGEKTVGEGDQERGKKGRVRVSRPAMSRRGLGLLQLSKLLNSDTRMPPPVAQSAARVTSLVEHSGVV